MTFSYAATENSDNEFSQDSEIVQINSAEKKDDLARGKMKAKSLFNKGFIVESREYYETGIIKEEVIFIKQKISLVREYYQTGNIKNQFDLKDRTYIEYGQDGSKKDEGKIDDTTLAFLSIGEALSLAFTALHDIDDESDKGKAVGGGEPNSLWLTDNGNSWSVGFNSDHPIAGFQFNIEGATINENGASDGAANDAGFTMSTSSTMVLGFSLKGETISVKEGILVVLELDGDPTGISGIVVADLTGQALDFSYDDGSDVKVEYYDNGAVKEEASYKNGKFEGAFREYYKNGSLKSEGVFVNGLIQGEVKEYYRFSD